MTCQDPTINKLYPAAMFVLKMTSASSICCLYLSALEGLRVL